MSNTNQLEHYQAVYAEKYEAMREARKNLIRATKAKWPIEMQVISHKFYGGPVSCTVIGYVVEGPDAGSLRLWNDSNAEIHVAWPYPGPNGFVSVEPALQKAD